MKNAFKLKAIQRIARIVTLLAVIGFSMVACGGNDDDVIYGCAYSQKESGANWEGKPMTTYLLTITFDKAKENITSKLGQPAFNEMGAQEHNFKSPYVIVQVIPGANEVRLIERTESGRRGIGWDTN